MNLRPKTLAVLLFSAAACVAAGAAIGQESARRVDHDRLTVHRLDIVDDKGVLRATLAAPTPEPVVNGKPAKRVFPVSGLVLFDAKGNERGGMGIADIPGSAGVLALDHDNMDAIGWRVMPDGSIGFVMNQKPRDASHGAPSRIRLSIAADGQPSLALADAQDRPRVRVTVTQEGYGALEFLDAKGKVIQTMAPEAGRGS